MSSLGAIWLCVGGKEGAVQQGLSIGACAYTNEPCNGESTPKLGTLMQPKQKRYSSHSVKRTDSGPGNKPSVARVLGATM